MKSLLLVRHGETELAGTFCGQSDPCLNPAGRAQAATLVDELAGVRIDAIFSSDLRRARETAETLAEARGLRVELLPALREIDFGQWEGLRWAEIERLDPAQAEAWVTGYPDVAAPGGEGFAEFCGRVRAAVETLLGEQGWESAAVVTHGGVMRVVLQQLMGLDDAEAWARTKRCCCWFRYPGEGAA